MYIVLPTQHFFSENIAKLGVHTKLVQCDGTFRAVPSTSTGHFYQNLMLHAKYEGHVMPFFKVIMTGKSGALYRAVFEKIKEELPHSVNPLCELRQNNQRKSTNGTASVSHVPCTSIVIYSILWNLLDN